MNRLTKFLQQIYSPKYLFLTNTVTGSLFFFAGDGLEQKIEKKFFQIDKQFDTKRNASMGLAGVYFGALGHYWYKFLDGKFPGPKRINILKKLLCEMAIGPPFAATAFVFVGRLENKKYQQIWTDLKNNMIFLCIADWCFYVPLQAINFYILPPKYRFLYVATISLVYDIFFSFLVHRNELTQNKS